MTDTNLLAQKMKIQNFEKGFVGIYLLNIGIQLGIFDKLSETDQHLTPVELAQALDLKEAYIDSWCHTAFHLKILNCDAEGRFFLDPQLAKLLTDTNSAYYDGHTIKFMTNHLAEQLLNVPEHYRKNSALPIEEYSREHSRCTRATTDQGVHIGFQQAIIPGIPGLTEKMKAGASVLDVGCGSGLLMIKLAQAFPACQFIGLEVDKYAFEDAQDNVIKQNMAHQITVKFESVADISDENEFDFITMSFSFHEINLNIREESIKKCYNALKNNGVIAIMDFGYPKSLEDFKKPIYTPGILDQFIELTQDSRHLSADEKIQFLDAHGFKNCQTISLVAGSIEAIFAFK